VKITKIILYDEPSVSKLSINNLQKFLVEIFEIEVEIRKNIFKNLDKKMFQDIASTRIFNLKKSFQKHIPSIEEIIIESENKDMSNKDEMAVIRWN